METHDPPPPLALRVASDLFAIGEGLERYMNELDDKSARTGSLAEIDARLDSEDVQTPALASLVGAVGFVTLGVASDHLRATHPLVIDHQGQVSVLRYAVYSVMRVAMEVAALTWWLVDDQVSPKTRLSRALTAMEDSRRQRQRSESRLGEQRDLQYLKVIRESVERQARKHRLQRITTRLDSGREIRIPDAIDLIAAQWRRASHGAEADAVAIYGMMSEPMHGSVLGTMMGFDPPDGPTGSLRPGVSTPHLVTAAHMTGHAVASAMLWFVMYMGWDHTRWSAIAQPALADLEDAIHIVNLHMSSDPAEY